MSLAFRNEISSSMVGGAGGRSICIFGFISVEVEV
jgi:hypothetical protein